MHISIEDSRKTIDLSKQLMQWMTSLPLPDNKKTLHLPLSLVMEENATLFDFVMGLIVPPATIEQTQQLTLKLDTDGLQGRSQLQQQMPHTAADSKRFALACYIVEDSLQGNLNQQWQEQHLEIDLTLSLAQSNDYRYRKRRWKLP